MLLRLAEAFIPSPEQTAGEGCQGRIQAHQWEAFPLGLGGQEPIEDEVSAQRWGSRWDWV